MRHDPRREPDSPEFSPIVEAPWETARPSESGTYRAVRSEPVPATSPEGRVSARADVVIQPRIERRREGVLVHVQLLNRTDPRHPRIVGAQSGPFATASVARHELERLLNMRLATTPGAAIEANGRTYTNVDDAMEGLWPLAVG